MIADQHVTESTTEPAATQQTRSQGLETGSLRAAALGTDATTRELRILLLSAAEEIDALRAQLAPHFEQQPTGILWMEMLEENRRLRSELATWKRNPLEAQIPEQAEPGRG